MKVTQLQMAKPNGVANQKLFLFQMYIFNVKLRTVDNFHYFNSLPNDKILDLSELKDFADDTFFNLKKMAESFPKG